ncbi:MAG: hypothetical protein JSV78_07780 [Phycisphaerales bacterium]|nr:MAG: hypothetical protein JSV78_07780 [Phycisphaerales bacterium]
MIRKNTTPLVTLAALTIATLAPAVADDFTIGWWTVDGGGEMFTTGTDFELSGTIGQPDASELVMTGGDFELTGGFWFGCAPGDCDCDGDVDLHNFVEFQACFLGPGGGLPEADCACFDFNADGDVDLGDFADFQAAFTTP